MIRAVPTIGVTIRLPGELHERLVGHRVATGEPTGTFVVRLIEAALDDEQQAKAKPSRRRAAG